MHDTRKLKAGACAAQGGANIHFAPSETLYEIWPTPVCIISDGPYGLSGYPGDAYTSEPLVDFYRPHVEAWTRKSTPQTTLWFWNSELGWATVHPLLLENGWEYRGCQIWDKGLGHIAGNCNTETLRKFPVVSEVCVQYVKRPLFQEGDKRVTAQTWLRSEWLRSGLPMYKANEACGVKNAATRKYLTADHLWYFPPPEAFERMAAYLNRHGKRDGRPYLSVDGVKPLTGQEWSLMRAKFTCPVGVTNVWQLPQVSGAERINGSRSSMKWKYSSLHGSQKPLRLIELTMRASTEEGDVVWEPFGGLCPVAIAALKLNRRSFSAEIVPEFYEAAVQRMRDAAESANKG